MGNRKDYLKKEIARISQKLDQKGLVANHDGNISVRFENFFLATPTAESKGVITQEMIIMVDDAGKKIEGPGNPFSEMKLHLAAYKARPEANAVVHAHPPFATARGLVGKDFCVSLPEAVISIGAQIPVARFAMPGAPENDAIIAEMLSLSDVFMLPGNGVLAIGDNIEQAYLRIELLEHVLKIDHLATQMGPPMNLSEKDLCSLIEKRKSLGLGPKTQTVSPTKKADFDPIRELIAEELRKILK